MGCCSGDVIARTKLGAVTPPLEVDLEVADFQDVGAAVGVHGSLSLATATAGELDAAYQAPEDGNPYTLALAPDGSGAGSIAKVGFAIAFHYQSGVTTLGDLNTAVATLTGFTVTTPGTTGHVLADPADTVGPLAFTPGRWPIEVAFRPKGQDGVRYEAPATLEDVVAQRVEAAWADLVTATGATGMPAGDYELQVEVNYTTGLAVYPPDGGYWVVTVEPTI